MSESTTTASVDKIEKANHTYSTPNYWAPLKIIYKEEKEEEESHKEQALAVGDQPKNTVQPETMIIDTGATLHFATDTIALPRTGNPSTKQVYLPDGTIIGGSETAELPVDLPTKAKVVDVLPNLKKSLFSVAKWQTRVTQPFSTQTTKESQSTKRAQ